MRTASISELKAHLSQYLAEVRRGGEVQILDRGVPVARLAGLERDGGQDDDRRRRLVRAGIVRAGSGDARSVLETPAPELPVSLSETLQADRDDRL